MFFLSESCNLVLGHDPRWFVQMYFWEIFLNKTVSYETYSNTAPVTPVTTPVLHQYPPEFLTRLSNWVKNISLKPNHFYIYHNFHHFLKFCIHAWIGGARWVALVIGEIWNEKFRFLRTEIINYSLRGKYYKDRVWDWERIWGQIGGPFLVA